MANINAETLATAINAKTAGTFTKAKLMNIAKVNVQMAAMLLEMDKKLDRVLELIGQPEQPKQSKPASKRKSS